MGKCLFMRKGGIHTAPVNGILAFDIAVGSSVYLMEGGTAVEYLVVNQGIPSGSSLYDASCDGTWLLRKDVVEDRQYSSNGNVDSKYASYSLSDIKSYLDDTFYNQFGTIEKNTIKQVKIPHTTVNYSGVMSVISGANGLTANVFLLSLLETQEASDNDKILHIPSDGACLTYFKGIAAGDADERRIAYLDGTKLKWATRSPKNNAIWLIMDSGSEYYLNPITTAGVRPALILPNTAIFDKNTLILKGVT